MTGTSKTWTAERKALVRERERARATELREREASVTEAIATMPRPRLRLTANPRCATHVREPGTRDLIPIKHERARRSID
jgi:hypothetical protein